MESKATNQRLANLNAKKMLTCSFTPPTCHFCRLALVSRNTEAVVELLVSFSVTATFLVSWTSEGWEPKKRELTRRPNPDSIPWGRWSWWTLKPPYKHVHKISALGKGRQNHNCADSMATHLRINNLYFSFKTANNFISQAHSHSLKPGLDYIWCLIYYLSQTYLQRLCRRRKNKMQSSSISGHHRAKTIRQGGNGVHTVFSHMDRPLTSHCSVSENVGPVVESTLRRTSQYRQPEEFT